MSNCNISTIGAIRVVDLHQLNMIEPQTLEASIKQNKLNIKYIFNI